jgi:formate dehydrogenase maturation protein FdhE
LSFKAEKALLLLSLILNGVRKTGGSLRKVSMGTVLAVTQQQSIEAAARSWARIHSTDRCPRCGGLMVAEWCQDLSDYSGQRCVQCGEVIDPVILQNRRR